MWFLVTWGCARFARRDETWSILGMTRTVLLALGLWYLLTLV